MRTWMKLLLISAIACGVAALIWLALGETSAFQRTPDIIGAALMGWFAIPLLALIALSVRALAVKWAPKNVPGHVLLLMIIIAMFGFSANLFKHVRTLGWLTEVVRTDQLKITEDQRYEYQIELVNLFQRNSKARLYLRDTSTGEEMRIPVDIRTRDIRVLAHEEAWGLLEPAGVRDRYILTTTRELLIPVESFEIDVAAGTSRRRAQAERPPADAARDPDGA